MKLHPFYQAIVDANAAAGRPFFHQLTPHEARALLKATTAAAPKPADLPELALIEDTKFAANGHELAVRIYDPRDAEAGTIVYAHAGGWVIGDLDFSDATCRRLCAASRSRLISVEYRLAPECAYPLALDDVCAAVDWAWNTFRSAIVIAGESAGGNLAAAAAIRLRDTGGTALAGQWLAYPVTDGAFDTQSYRNIGDRNWLLSTADMKWFWDHYCPDEDHRRDPTASPLRVADATGLPPAMIVVAQLDPLRDEGLAFANRLATDGVKVSTRCDPGMAHGYLGAASVIPIAAEAVIESGRWIRAALDRAKV